MSDLVLLKDKDSRPANKDVVELFCNYCGTFGTRNYGQAKRCAKERGYGYKCKACMDKAKKDAKTPVFDSEFLKSVGAVDTDSRQIRNKDMVEFYCKCGEKGNRRWSDAKKSKERHGFYYQCASCLKQKYKDRAKNSPTWLAGIRAAAQTDDHKRRARENGRKRLLIKSLGSVQDYWAFDVDIQKVAGTELVEGTCKTCRSKEKKPLKKFIEAVDNQTHGCSSCWLRHAHGDKHQKDMLEASKDYWSSPESENARNNLRLRSPELCEAYDQWVVNNPDKAFSSKAELEILEWVKSLGLEAFKHRQGGQEIDIYIPDLKIGIEYNGLYWHSEARKENTYHIGKTGFFKEHDIQVIHVFEHEWRDRQDQVKSFLRSKLKKNENRIGARKLDIVEISATEARDFTEKYHIQGKPQHVKLALALKNNNEIIALATFARHHRNNGQWVMNRFVCCENWTVSGGLSRLVKHAARILDEPIISWCDLRWSTGSGYKNAGWAEDEILKPDYFYTNGRTVVSKQSRRKSAVNTPTALTEHKHALLDGLLRVYDCGKIRFRYSLISDAKCPNMV